ncbi:CU044_5270 family protein [Actinoallomurus sp. NPDC052274]|uniref:CU044_5270 family protein n=1 Tax=Actinoallomurus sp. NPDC052274 TaxID=3155420 RepID=UPI00341F2005
MDVEERRLSQAMHRAAGGIEPEVSALVDGGVRRGRRMRLRHRARNGAAVAAVTAAAVTAGVLTLGSGGTTTTQAPTVRLASASEVLGKAAQAAETRPQPIPRMNQWLYEKTLEYGIGTEAGTRHVTREDWARFDGAKTAELQNGKLVYFSSRVPVSRYGQKKYRALASLPTDPTALRRKIYKDVDRENRSDWRYPTRDGEAFGNAAQWIWSTPVGIPPKTQAALYRVIATIPGVTVEKVKDGAGRPAIAVTHGYGEQFLLDPATYQMVGQRTVNNGHNAPISKTNGVDPKWKGLPVGAVTKSLTRVTVKVVDRAGER